MESGWVLARSRAHRAADGYVSLENQLWDGKTRKLVAHATQLAFIRFLDKDVAEPILASQ